MQAQLVNAQLQAAHAHAAQIAAEAVASFAIQPHVYADLVRVVRNNWAVNPQPSTLNPQPSTLKPARVCVCVGEMLTICGAHNRLRRWWM